MAELLRKLTLLTPMAATGWYELIVDADTDSSASSRFEEIRAGVAWTTSVAAPRRMREPTPSS